MFHHLTGCYFILLNHILKILMEEFQIILVTIEVKFLIMYSYLFLQILFQQENVEL